MPKNTFSLDGLEELEANLKEIGKANAKNALRKALQDAAQPLLKDMKAYAPKDTGNLEESIIMSSKNKYQNAGKKAYRNAMVRGDGKQAAAAAARAANRSSSGEGDKSFAEVFVGPTKKAPYGVPQEFGTFKMPAHPFMRPAWDKNKMPMLENLSKYLQDRVSKSVARLRKRKLKR